MDPYFAEFVGTAILILLGCGVNANVSLKLTTGNDAGWIVICAGWGFSVFTAVLCVGEYSGAHINPAVTIGLAAAGEFDWSQVGGYLIAQMLGAFVGAVLVYVLYKMHFEATEDPAAKLGTFSTGPSIPSVPLNFATEAIATFVLVYAVLSAIDPSFTIENNGNEEEVKIGLGAVGAFPVGIIVFAIGLCLGGPTGYAINPARDLSPRIAHAVLPIPDKGDSNWSYAWIPVVGPIAGGILAAILYRVQ